MTDTTTWAEAHRRYDRLVRARVRAFRLQPGDQEDAVQATWLRFAERFTSVREEEALPGWLSVVAARECLDILRRSAGSPVVGGVTAERSDPDADVERSAVDGSVATILWRLVAALPPHERDVVTALFGPAPATYAEAARAGAVAVGTIGPTRARAIERLRRMIDEEGLWAALTDAAREADRRDAPARCGRRTRRPAPDRVRRAS
jgi:RNA polymerase sigma factor (sigma-70 family)